MQKLQNIQDQERRKCGNIELGDSQWVIIIKWMNFNPMKNTNYIGSKEEVVILNKFLLSAIALLCVEFIAHNALYHTQQRSL